MVDWRLAERVAEAVAGGDGAGPPLAGGADLDAMAARACEHVSEYARMQPAVPPPPLEAVGRKEWARANLETMGGTLEPLLERLGSGPLQSVGGALIGVEAGGIVGFMGRNVLGQYELALLDPERPPRLLLVAPNLREAARTFEADEAELLEWVVFHEITHAVQFTGRPVAARAPGRDAARAAVLGQGRGRPGGAAAPAQAAGPARGVGRGARGRPRACGRRARAQGDHRSPAGGRWRSSRATPST